MPSGRSISVTFAPPSVPSALCDIEIATTDDRTEKASVKLQGVIEYRLQSAEADSSEQLLVAADHPLLLDYGPQASIFGNAPLPDPPRFYLDFTKLVQKMTEGRRDPQRYLSRTLDLSQWVVMVYSRTYCLLTAPAAIAEAACELLEAQALEYTLLPASPPTEELPRAIIWGSSWFIARNVQQNFEEQAGDG